MESIRPVFFSVEKKTPVEIHLGFPQFIFPHLVGRISIARLLVSLTTLREVGWAVATP